MEKINLQVESLKWLYDMEMVDHPQLINHLKLNIYTMTKGVKNIELLVLQDQKSMVIYYEMGFLAKILNSYKSNNLIIEDLIKQLLPNFRLRIVNNKELFTLILNKAKEYLHGQTFYTDIPNMALSATSSPKTEPKTSL